MIVTLLRIMLVAVLAVTPAFVGQAVAGQASSSQAKNPCEAPDEISGAVTALPDVASVLKPGGEFEVLAVGSATLFGPEASLETTGPSPPVTATPITTEASEKAFPKRMAKALQVAVPGSTVHVTVRGGRGLSAGEMLAVIRKEMALKQYQLVIWQTGTVEAVRNTPPGEFARVLSEGAEAVQAAHANLLLVDAQFSRFLQTNSNLDPYMQAMQQLAAMPGVLLFRRYDLMRHWVTESQIDLERTARGDRRRMVEVLHGCLGSHLARMVLGGARS